MKRGLLLDLWSLAVYAVMLPLGAAIYADWRIRRWRAGVRP